MLEKWQSFAVCTFGSEQVVCAFRCTPCRMWGRRQLDCWRRGSFVRVQEEVGSRDTGDEDMIREDKSDMLQSLRSISVSL